ncbi:MAG: type II toxin-antitoxin system Phd/YefM family antitoxin [Patescibacteria group bacterium]
MNTASISQLKANPASVISQADDYPVAVESRSKVRAYLIGKQLYEKLLDLVEDKLDRSAVAGTDFHKGKNFEAVAEDLGI